MWLTTLTSMRCHLIDVEKEGTWCVCPVGMSLDKQLKWVLKSILWGTHHHLSIRKACTLKVPQRKSHANDNKNLITQINLLQYRNLSRKKAQYPLNAPTAIRSNEHRDLLLQQRAVSYTLWSIMETSVYPAHVWMSSVLNSWCDLPSKSVVVALILERAGGANSGSMMAALLSHMSDHSKCTQDYSMKPVNLNFKSLFSSVCH